MKVICINNKNWEDVLEVGKIYNTSPVTIGGKEFNDSHYVLQGINHVRGGIPIIFLRDNFLPLSEYRNNKLNQIL
jgi:hypothetical protein